LIPVRAGASSADPACGAGDHQRPGIVDHMPGIRHQRQRPGSPADTRFDAGKSQGQRHGKPH